MNEMNGIAQILPRAEKDRIMAALAALYADMDREYGTVSARYAFVCSGCVDNCCMTRFYHHTALEYLYLREGFLALDASGQMGIKTRAADYNTRQKEFAARGDSPWIMCPLNIEGRCILYDHRPMICRLHGIPHEFAPPGRPRVYGQGCAEFTEHCGNMPYVVFDRTPFYMEMAALERRLKEAADLTGKIKMTIAGMLTAIASETGGELP